MREGGPLDGPLMRIKAVGFCIVVAWGWPHLGLPTFILFWASITLFKSITMSCGIGTIWLREIFYIILSVPQNIVMNLNNVLSTFPMVLFEAWPSFLLDLSQWGSFNLVGWAQGFLPCSLGFKPLGWRLLLNFWILVMFDYQRSNLSVFTDQPERGNYHIRVYLSSIDRKNLILYKIVANSSQMNSCRLIWDLES